MFALSAVGQQDRHQEPGGLLVVGGEADEADGDVSVIGTGSITSP